MYQAVIEGSHSVYKASIAKMRFKISILFLLFMQTTFFTAIADGGFKSEIKQPHAFIENKGQFTIYDKHVQDNDVLYCLDNGEERIMFTRTGVTFHYLKKLPYELYRERQEIEQGLSKEEQHRGNYLEWLDEELTKRKTKGEWEEYTITWANANASVEVEAKDQVQGYFSYSFQNGKSIKHQNFIKGYKRLIYKNLYPNIDIIYTVHPDIGFKYKIVLHPGALLSDLKMMYNKDIMRNQDGDIVFFTMMGDVIDHHPVAWYDGQDGHHIKASFSKNHNTIGFNVPGYDNTETLIIDPWVQTPVLTNPTGVWEVEVDGSGNVYVIGGGTPMVLIKYDPTGAFQWSYNTPYDTSNGDWLGAMATDNAGNSYVTRGSTAAISKIDAAGNVLYNVNGGALDEYWQIAFNCDQTRLLIGGTRLPLFPVGTYQSAMIYDINTSNGSVISSVFVNYSQPGFTGNPDEVRAISSSFNAKYYYLTLDTLGAFDQGLGSACPNPQPALEINHGYDFSYKCEDYRPDNGNGPISAIVADASYLFTQDGATVDKRDLNTGAILATAPIPGGINTTVPIVGGHQAGNSGIAMDDCGNVYVGSSDRVLKYDVNLNQLAQVMVSYRVSDVEVSPNGDIAVCGSTGTSSSASRTGYVETVSLNPCAPITLVCCDANVCPPGVLCVTDPPVTLIPNTTGGTWSGTGVNASGVFDPAAAGVGVHTITYTLACGSGTIDITVSPCTTLNICTEANGDLTVSGGVGPYTWFEPTWTQDCSACFPIPPCSLPPGCVVNVLGWNSFATGTTATPYANADTIAVVSGTGDTTYVWDITTLPACSSCSMTSTNTSTNETCGQIDGSGTVSPTGGTTPYTYLWDGNASNQTTATATGLPAGTYSVTITDGASCSIVETVTVNSTPGPNANTTATDENCGQSDGTATVSPSGGSSPYTYLWDANAGNQTTATATGLSAGSYTVTVSDANNCTITVTATVGSVGGPSGGTTVTDENCGLGDGTATVTASGGNTPYTYLWDANTGNQTTATATGLSAGSYTVTVTDAGSCTVTVTATVGSIGGPSASTTVTDENCGLSDGTATVTASGGNTPYTYLWDANAGNQTTTTATGLSAGTYSVTVTDNAGCTYVTTASPGSVAGPSANASGIDVLCNGDATGSGTVTTTGGSTPYTYLWDTAANNQTSATATGLLAGSYAVTVTDNSGCTSVVAVTITEPTAINLSITSTDENCGAGDGTATATTSGGVTPYTYLWSSGQSTAAITGLSVGTYTVTITDNNGCTAVSSVNISSIGGPVVNTNTTQETCPGTADGTATATPSGGTPPYTYNWSNGQTAQTATALGAGTYTVTVTDNGGCSTVNTVTVTAPPPITTSITGATNVCIGQSTTLTASGGSVYTWSSGGGTASETVSPTATTIYYVTVSDGICSAIDSVTVSVILTPVASISGNTAICSGINTTLSATGGSTYQWSTGSTTAQITVSSEGTYYVTVSNSCGSDVDSVIVNLSAGPVADAGEDVSITEGSSTSLGASGGTSYYWSPDDDLSCSNCQNPEASPLTTTTYYVTVTDGSGCYAVDSVIVTVDAAECMYYIPNIFSPNDDGANDILYVKGTGFDIDRFIIYDRWGEKVFETSDQSLGWDGSFHDKPLNPSVFIYYFRATCKNDGSEIKDQGDITLIR